MKRYLFTLLFLGQITFSFAQRGINYQAVVRDANGKPLSNKDAIVQVSIFDTVNAVLYQEEHYVKSNAVGTVSLLIGNGIATSVGIYNTINPLPWASQQLSTEVKINTGSGFVSFGKMLLQPVPYALVADTALYIKNPKISVQQLKDVDVTNLLANDVLRWNGSKWVRGDSVKVDHLAVRKGLNVHAESEFDKKVKLNAAFSFKNGVQVDSISNDSLLSKSSPTALVTEQATKKYVDNKLKNGINGNVLKDVFKPNDTTLLFTFSDLTTKSVLLQQAKNRTFITNATLYGNGDLVFTFSDTTTLNVEK